MTPRSRYVMALFDAAETGQDDPNTLADLAQKWAQVPQGERGDIVAGLESWARRVLEAHVRQSLFEVGGVEGLSPYGRAYLITCAKLISMGERDPAFESVQDELDDLHERMTPGDVLRCNQAICAVRTDTLV